MVIPHASRDAKNFTENKEFVEMNDVVSFDKK